MRSSGKMLRFAGDPSGVPSAWRLFAADLSGVSSPLLDDPESLEAALGAALGAFAPGIAWSAHRFAPTGVSIVGTAKALRLAIHTWPERRAATLDLYGSGFDPEPLLRRCVDAILATQHG